MLRRHEISDADRNRIKDFLPGQPGQHGGVADDNRRFINAVLWIARTGAPWRALPERLGNGNSPWRRFDRWAAQGRLARVADVLRDPDLDVLILDSTVIRAHSCADGAKKVGWPRRQEEQALGRSRGDFGTKIHGSFNGRGHPVVVSLTTGQALDIGPAETLLRTHTPKAVIADKGYDSNDFVAMIQKRGAAAVIPPKANRLEPRAYDRHTYKERNLVERFWSKAKQFRRVAPRYEKKAANFLAFVHLAAILVMLQ